MPFLIFRQKVEDYEKWLSHFLSQSEIYKEAGLYDRQLLLDVNDPDIVVCIFKVKDIEKAKEFTKNRPAEESKAESGIIDKQEILFLNEV